MTITDVTPYVAIVRRPVIAVHRLYKDFVALDDLLQEAFIWWYGPGQKHLDKYLDEASDYVLLRRSIWRWCMRYAEKEKAHASGYEPFDQQRYSAREIQAVLPLALNADGVPGGGGPQEGPSAKGNLAEGGLIMAVLMDVRRALDSLAEDDIRFLYLAEDLAHDWERVVTHLGAEIQPDTARRRHSRICIRLARYLNGPAYEEETAA